MLLFSLFNLNIKYVIRHAHVHCIYLCMHVLDAFVGAQMGLLEFLKRMTWYSNSEFYYTHMHTHIRVSAGFW